MHASGICRGAPHRSLGSLGCAVLCGFGPSLYLYYYSSRYIKPPSTEQIAPLSLVERFAPSSHWDQFVDRASAETVVCSGLVKKSSALNVTELPSLHALLRNRTFYAKSLRFDRVRK